MPQTPLYHVSRGTDSYKFTHHRQYPPGTEQVHSYWAPRGKPDFWPDWYMFDGLQFFLKRYLVGQIVDSVQVALSQKRVNAHMGSEVYNAAGWQRIVDKYGGKLPITIWAYPEGSILPIGEPGFIVQTNDKELFWLASWVETLLSKVWQATTVATNSRGCLGMLREALERSGDPAGVFFKLHDFGDRGCGSVEEAAVAGAAHLKAGFMGTDTFEAIDMLYDYYGATEMPGFSIPASEHSTITSWGKEREYEAFQNMLTQFPTGLVACVSDSYNIWVATEVWGTRFKEQILARPGTLVERPDSGPLPETPLQVLAALERNFGTTVNSKGYKVLPPQIRVIQGDGINRKTLAMIIDALLDAKWSLDNIAFGSGGGLLRDFTRDTLKCAYKCSAITIDGVEHDVFKDPITAPDKKSIRGRIDIGRRVKVFQDGDLLVDQTVDEIRKRAA